MVHKINAIYASFDGEVNAFGIGAPTIFIRFQGCHLRCYKKTIGVLCDTPEGLSKEGGKDMTNEEIIDTCFKIRDETGVKKVTVTGGDPLWRPVAPLYRLFWEILASEFDITVETSGTLSIEPFVQLQHFGDNNLYWVLDYKLSSAGVTTEAHLKIIKKNLTLLGERDYLKFVIYDKTDYERFLETVEFFIESGLIKKFKTSVGLFWGDGVEFTYLQLLDKLKEDGILGYITVNFQTHKLMLKPNYSTDVPKLL